jgi:hypothetical protein
MQSARDTPSISELVNVLETNGVIPAGGERRSRESADIITRIGDRVDRGERITSDEFQHGDYTLAIAWFDSILPDMEE